MVSDANEVAELAGCPLCNDRGYLSLAGSDVGCWCREKLAATTPKPAAAADDPAVSSPDRVGDWKDGYDTARNYMEIAIRALPDGSEEPTNLGDLPSRMMGWVGKARTRGLDRIELELAAVDRLLAYIARHRLAALPSTPPAASCAASPDHADIMETIANAADNWQAQGYTSALAEVRDMANVGRALMEALPEGYSYINCPSEIVSDLQNERDEALATPPAADAGEVERLQEALAWYAEQAQGCRKIGSAGDPFRHALDFDGGNRARAALAPRDHGEASDVR